MIYSMELQSQETGLPYGAESEAAAQGRCERCGAPSGVKVGTRWLCQSCYAEAGSCCLEFGGDDLWKLDETKPV
jgi:hypothetical protein